MSSAEPELPLNEVAAQQAELDALDVQILALVTRRLKAEDTLTDARKAAGEPFAVRPARETALLRRLIAKNDGALEPDMVAELWRVLIGAHLRRQGPIDISVAGGADPVRLFDVARRHFGARTRIQRALDPRAALMQAVENPNTLAVVPWPAAGGPGGWWPALTESRFHKLVLIAGLPLRGAPGVEPEAGVFALGAPLEAAGGDVTLALAFDQHRRAARILADAGFAAHEVARSEPRVLYRIDGFVAPDDIRVSTLARGGGVDGFRVVGSFARV